MGILCSIFEITILQDEVLLVDNLIECANIIGVSVILYILY